MARKKVNQQSDVVKRNLELVQDLMQYLYKNPHLFQSLPDDFDLVILPDDDPEMRLFNLELLDARGKTGKPVVFARVHSSFRGVTNQWRPDLYVPVTV